MWFAVSSIYTCSLGGRAGRNDRLALAYFVVFVYVCKMRICRVVVPDPCLSLAGREGFGSCDKPVMLTWQTWVFSVCHPICHVDVAKTLYFCWSPFGALVESRIKNSRIIKTKAVTGVSCISLSPQSFHRRVFFADLFHVNQPKWNFTMFQKWSYLAESVVNGEGQWKRDREGEPHADSVPSAEPCAGWISWPWDRDLSHNRESDARQTEPHRCPQCYHVLSRCINSGTTEIQLGYSCLEMPTSSLLDYKCGPEKCILLFCVRVFRWGLWRGCMCLQLFSAERAVLTCWPRRP